MSFEHRKELARRLLDVKGEWSLQKLKDIDKKMGSHMRGRANEVVERLRNLQVDLHAEFFSEEDLTAEIDFYESDVGKRIVRNRRLMHEELQRRGPVAFADLDEELKSAAKESSGQMKGLLKKWPPSDDG